MCVCNSRKMSQPKCLNRILIIVHPVMEQMELFDTTQLLKTQKSMENVCKDKKIRIPLQFAEDLHLQKTCIYLNKTWETR